MKRKDFGTDFETDDTDNDGYLTKAELEKSKKFSALAKNFDKIDGLVPGKDGTLKISRQTLYDSLDAIGIFSD